MAEEAETDTETESEDGAEGAEGAEGAAGKAKPGLVKLALFIGLPAVILILAGVAAALLLLGGGEDEADAEEAEAVQTDYWDQVQTLSPFENALQVSLSRQQGRSPTLIVSFEIAYLDPLVAQRVREPVRNAALRDSYTEFLLSLRPEDLDGSMGHFRLKSELVRRTNLILAPHEVEDVLINEFMLQ
ncbi:MAG: flagellar basal body-associated FliL family protein [Oceanicaulis sp.]|nr:flagellar basal body-associated FliL family protein [Oceanicaulis sp.]